MNRTLDDFGRRLAELRAQAGLTQERLAEKLGVTTRHVQKLEQGLINAGVLVIVRLAAELGVHPGELFEPSSYVRRPGRPRKNPAPEPAAPAKPDKKTAAKKRPRKR